MAKREPTELEKDLDRLRVAWNTNLQNDVEPMSRVAVERGIAIMRALPELLSDVSQMFKARFTDIGASLSPWERALIDRVFAVQQLLEPV